jgi:uncharacterized protein (TIGR00251 family)
VKTPALHEAAAVLREQLRGQGALALAVRVIPKSPQTAWAGALADGAYRVRLHAVPEKGKANEELIRFLAAELGVPRAQVEIVAGHTSQRKQVRVRA